MFARHLEWRQGEGAPESLAAAHALVPTLLICGGAQRILFVQGARYDLSAATPEQYTQAICHAMDEALGTDEEARLTVLIDIRGGDGWPNPSAIRLLPFLRRCAARLERMIIYPLPWLAMAILAIVKQLLDPVTFSKLVVIAGDDSRGAPCPAEELRKYVAKESLPKHVWLTHQGLK